MGHQLDGMNAIKVEILFLDTTPFQLTWMQLWLVTTLVCLQSQIRTNICLDKTQNPPWLVDFTDVGMGLLCGGRGPTSALQIYIRFYANYLIKSGHMHTHSKHWVLKTQTSLLMTSRHLSEQALRDNRLGRFAFMVCFAHLPTAAVCPRPMLRH